jgi:hypothetical protein
MNAKQPQQKMHEYQVVAIQLYLRMCLKHLDNAAVNGVHLEREIALFEELEEMMHKIDVTTFGVLNENEKYSYKYESNFSSSSLY